MRPSEAKNLRWRDVSIRKDREGRDVAVLWVSGKGKARELVAPASVAEYIEHIRTIAKASERTTGSSPPTPASRQNRFIRI
jgi:integrase